MPIGKNRGRVLDPADATKGLTAIHPSFSLRTKEEDRTRGYALLIAAPGLARPVAERTAA
jgi:hypothetical protein